jgi:hypothetical protein
MDEDPEFHEMKDAHATKKETDRLELAAKVAAEESSESVELVEASTPSFGVNTTEVDVNADVADITLQPEEAGEEEKPKKRGRPKKEAVVEANDTIDSAVVAPLLEASPTIERADASREVEEASLSIAD